MGSWSCGSRWLVDADPCRSSSVLLEEEEEDDEEEELSG